MLLKHNNVDGNIRNKHDVDIWFDKYANCNDFHG